MSPRAQDIIDAARACVGTPFQHQGRQPGLGLDCAGLLVVALAAVGFAALDRTDYGRRPFGGELEAMLEAQPLLVRVPIPEMRPADILLMRIKRDPQHLALLAGDTIIHAWEDCGKVAEHRLDTRWRQRIVRVYRIAELAR
jgi:cell wall-associated NlpC family hydrolase